MKQTATSIAVYSADTFGVCSALYELGGLVVIHDPSGCNSTYTTHDEPRWYQYQSLIFISGLSEIDAILGNDNKFINAVCKAAKEFSPAFIALLQTPIPLMTGTDFPAIAKIIERETGIPTFPFLTSNMDTYIKGVSSALAMLVKNFVDDKVLSPTSKTEIPINILGCTPLDFALNGSVDSIKSFLKKKGFHIISSFAMDTNLSNIKQASSAKVNLVVSAGGLAAAKYLYDQYKIPYVIGVPIGHSMCARIYEDLLRANVTSDMECLISYENRPHYRHKVYIIGESVYSSSLAYALSDSLKVNVSVICPLEIAVLKDNSDVIAEYETDIISAIDDAELVIADPLYKPIVPKKIKFIELPHIAFSGRCYEQRIPDLIFNTEDFLGLVSKCLEGE